MKQLIIGNCDSQNKKLNKKERPHYFTEPYEFYLQHEKFLCCGSNSNSCFKIINRPRKILKLKKINGEQLSQKPFKNENHQQTIDFLTSVPLIVTLVE